MLDIPNIKDGLDAYIQAKKLKKTALSYSQLSSYWGCPFRWQLGTINKIRLFKPSIHLLFGSAIHETLQYWLTVRFNESVENSNKLNLNDLLFDNMSRIYTEDIKKHGKYLTPEALAEIYNSGTEILSYISTNADEYFPTKDYELIGYEVPIFIQSDKNENIIISGFIDLVRRYIPEDLYLLDDFKSSGKAWDEYKKSDFATQGQLLLYKYYFSKQFNIPIENIQTRYVILKKQINSDSRYQEKRIQLFEPATGKIKIKEYLLKEEQMINEAFNPDGTYQQKKYPKTENKNQCMWCDYKGTEYCNAFPVNPNK